MKNPKEIRRIKRHKHILKKVLQTAHPRLVVKKGTRRIFLSLVDDSAGKVLTSVVFPLKECEKAGGIMAEKAKSLNISKVVFDRAGYKYHGIIKKVADAVRSGGLEF